MYYRQNVELHAEMKTDKVEYIFRQPVKGSICAEWHLGRGNLFD